MAYCKKCGAYIPNHQNSCFACGYNEAAETAPRDDEARRVHQEETREWAEAEKQRCDAEREKSSAAAQRSNGKLVATLSYIGILCVIGLIFHRDDEFVKFHAKQGLVLLLFEIVGLVVGTILSLRWLFRAFAIYCIVVGIINVQNGRRKPLPLLGKLKLF